MVDLAKIRKKAKQKADNRQPTTDNAAAKLAAFLETAGTARFPEEAPIETARDEVELLTFILGAERYAIDIESVAEISAPRPHTRVPNSDPGTVGIFSLRGAIVTLLDLRSKLKQPPASGGNERQVIIVRDGAGLAGFEVDRVLRPAKIARAAIDPQPVVAPGEESDFIRGVVRGENALTIVLDLAKLIA